MNISVELTFTPLQDQYRDRIKNFIIDLRSGGFTISETPLSTQLYGPYDALMPFLMKTIKTALGEEEKGIMHLKIYNADRSSYVSDF